MPPREIKAWTLTTHKSKLPANTKKAIMRMHRKVWCRSMMILKVMLSLNRQLRGDLLQFSLNKDPLLAMWGSKMGMQMELRRDWLDCIRNLGFQHIILRLIQCLLECLRRITIWIIWVLTLIHLDFKKSRRQHLKHRYTRIRVLLRQVWPNVTTVGGLSIQSQLRSMNAYARKCSHNIGKSLTLPRQDK